MVHHAHHFALTVPSIVAQAADPAGSPAEGDSDLYISLLISIIPWLVFIGLLVAMVIVIPSSQRRIERKLDRIIELLERREDRH